ncbi:hypothetical protein BOX15_Mlig025274g1 [Macrostomum lignano]|uniref:Sodium/potassium-transporting ATPase subunit beta n=1 Tax=Macrostomum lignano TaxID=282301 RepID=A0A267G0E2_9PLAT|nr:hypothetical protein BOX15_Mlig025274g1 [Macrostomum lignano]
MTEDNQHEAFVPEPEFEEPSKVSRCAAFLHFLYNKQTGKVMGRSGMSWLKILIFYTIFYSCLAGFFVGMLSVFMYGVLVDNQPHRTGDNSLLQMNPGLGFRPQPDMSSTLIEFTAGKPGSYARLVANIQELFDTYKRIELKPEQVHVRAGCQPDSKPDGQPFKVCKFNWTRELPDCLPANDFGYASGQPCVVLKLNKIFGWLPDPVDERAPHALVECHGENPADTESIGDVAYQPSVSLENNATGEVTTYGFFNQAFYPYLKQIGYRAPLVALKFNNLRPNTLVMVECVLRNLRNSQYSKVDREAMARFEILMKK